MLDANSGYAWSPDGARLAVQVQETRQGNTDLNGDGDASDSVLQVWDAATGVVTNLMLDAYYNYTWSPDSAHLAVRVHEGRQGNTDLSGDGDANDLVLHLVTFFNAPPRCHGQLGGDRHQCGRIGERADRR